MPDVCGKRRTGHDARRFLLTVDNAFDTSMAVWRRVMAVLCARYPVWWLDCLDCCGEEEPEGEHTAAEVLEWLSRANCILFARALGYAGEAANEEIADYAGYMRAACRCAALCETVEYTTDENDGRTTLRI